MSSDQPENDLANLLAYFGTAKTIKESIPRIQLVHTTMSPECMSPVPNK